MLWNNLCTVQICITFMVNKKDDLPIAGQDEIWWERKSRSTHREEERWSLRSHQADVEEAA